MRRLAVLGSTGSIGESTLRVVDRHPDRFEVVALAANGSVAALSEQAARYGPGLVVVADPARAPRAGARPGWRSGREALLEACSAPDVDVVVNAIVGSAGLEPTLRALEAGKHLALANKESLVAGGPLVMETLRRGSGELIPIDSEHSAILQCLEGANRSEVTRIVLTASGGPFRGWTREAVDRATPEEALRHPTWEMGAKITVDSATLANKALEVIEAHFLYGVPYEAIEVVVHPQSIVHSLVEFRDGSVLAQLGFPTMELPILIALSYPERVEDASLQTFDPVRCSPLSFEPVDQGGFPLFSLGLEAGRRGGVAPAVFNAANEVAVSGFLEGSVSFRGMAEAVEATLDRVGDGAVGSLDDVLEADRAARGIARELIGVEKAVESR